MLTASLVKFVDLPVPVGKGRQRFCKDSGGRTSADKKFMSARISAIATHLPAGILSNDELAEGLDTWTAEKIFAKTGIRNRTVAADGETAGDLASLAAQRLFREHKVSPESVDFLIFCTQSPDYFLPTTACLIHQRIGLSSRAGAIDVNQGCSGFVYCLSLAKGLIAAGAASRVLILTADTYTKYINPRDKSVRTLFGDAGAAIIVDACPDQSLSQIGQFVFGTDGAGARNLIVPAGGAREPISDSSAVETTDHSGNIRSARNLYMNGPEILAFTLSACSGTGFRIRLRQRQNVDGVGCDHAPSYNEPQRNESLFGSA